MAAAPRKEGLMSTERRHIPINYGGSEPHAARAAGALGNDPVDSPRRGTPAGGAGAGTGAEVPRPGAAPGAEQASSGQAGGATAPAGKGHTPGGRPAHGPSAEVHALTEERDALTAERDALAKERDALDDALLRLRAEFENFRRRTARDILAAGGRAQADLLVDLLPVFDNLDRALDAAEHHDEGKVLDGVRMTRNMFANLLARAGVEPIEGLGDPFDPNLHEAVMVQASDEEEGHVAAVLQKGYRQGDRVLRAARVAVSTGETEPAVAG